MAVSLLGHHPSSRVFISAVAIDLGLVVSVPEYLSAWPK